MKPGRGDMPKTGNKIPLEMKSPNYMVDGPGDKKVEAKKDVKSKAVKKDAILERLKEQYPNKTITPKANKLGYTMMDSSGHTVTVNPSAKKKSEKAPNLAEGINKALKKGEI